MALTCSPIPMGSPLLSLWRADMVEVAWVIAVTCAMIALGLYLYKNRNH